MKNRICKKAQTCIYTFAHFENKGVTDEKRFFSCVSINFTTPTNRGQDSNLHALQHRTLTEVTLFYDTLGFCPFQIYYFLRRRQAKRKLA
jgi:hypothetical protein